MGERSSCRQVSISLFSNHHQNLAEKSMGGFAGDGGESLPSLNPKPAPQQGDCGRRKKLRRWWKAWQVSPGVPADGGHHHRCGGVPEPRQRRPRTTGSWPAEQTHCTRRNTSGRTGFASKRPFPLPLASAPGGFYSHGLRLKISNRVPPCNRNCMCGPFSWFHSSSRACSLQVEVAGCGELV